MAITVHTLLFARYAELLGADQLTLTLPEGIKAGEAVSQVRNQHPGNALPSTVLLAINGRQATLDRPLHDGDELAILPPLAGG
jgi:molybdopterin converting factor small subunit